MTRTTPQKRVNSRKPENRDFLCSVSAHLRVDVATRQAYVQCMPKTPLSGVAGEPKARDVRATGRIPSEG
jgi:hypothetical protein